MRGVVSLAAALSLPDAVPGRDLIVFLTFCVILVTLVVQGLSLPWLIRRLGLAAAPGPDCEEREARRILIESALQYIEESRRNDGKKLGDLYDDMVHHYQEKLTAVEGGGVDDSDGERHRQMEQELLRVERRTAIRLRDEGRINDEVLRRLERELDLSEARLEQA